MELVRILFLFLVPLVVLGAQHSPSQPRGLAVLPSSSNYDGRHPGGIEDLDLLDIVLTASVDGKFHALNRTNGQLKWSMRDVPSDPESHNLLHELVRTNHTVSSDIHDEVDGDETYVIEPQSGEIYVLPPGSSSHTPMERLPFTIPQLVDMSPFRFAGDDLRMFLGKKETSLITLDLDTGAVISIYNADHCVWEEGPAPELEPSDDTSFYDSFDDPDSEFHLPRPKTMRREIIVGRTDYHVAVHIRGRGIVQNLSYSVYGPNNIDRDRQVRWTRTPDDRYLQPLPDGQVMSFRTSKETSDSLEWSNAFSQPTVAVFDVVCPARQSAPILLLQPQPRLNELFFGSRFESQLASLPESTYVGLVGHSLYAMSHLHYPLVAFSDTRRRITSRSDVGQYQDGIDAVDRVCDSLECLVGTHHSEYAASSRLSRLIDSGSKLLIEGPGTVDDVDDVTFHPRLPAPPGISLLPVSQMLPAYINTLLVGALGLATYLFLHWRRRRRSLKVFSIPAVGEVPLLVSPSSVEPDLSPLASAPDGSSLNETPSKGVLDLEDSDQDAADGDMDGDAEGGRKRRRRRRGKSKKKVEIVLPIPGNDAKGSAEAGVSDDYVHVDAPRAANEFAANVSSPAAEADASALQPTPDLSPPPRVPLTSSLTVSDAILGFGSHGTMVYRGAFQGRAVAVKRLLQDFVTVASREVALLQESDDHPNVIRYFYQEAKDNFLYIALELCPASLEDILQRPNMFPEITAVFQPKRALAQITSGLRHLHALKIVHRDIKPQNILISQAKNGIHRMLISDFGLCKKLEIDETSFLPTRHGPLGAGTVGWRAPEILRGEVTLDVLNVDSIGSLGNSSSLGGTDSTGPGSGSGSNTNKTPRTRLTKSVDIFALGCLFFYTLTGGEHPFGGPFERESNILKNRKDLTWLERLGEEGEEAKDLIDRMLDSQPKLRLDTSACLTHPFFWTAARRLSFLQDASDRFEIMERDPPERGLVSLETGAFDVVGIDWHKRLDKVFIDNLGKFRKYNGKSVQDLLRALRNKKHHYQDLPDNVKRHLGPLPDGFLAYFTNRFPRLFLHVYYVVANLPLSTESMFRSYFELHDT